MISHYFKQAWRLLKENQFFSLVYIGGTALSITMVMLILVTYDIKTSDYSPETNRGRTLYVQWGYVADKKSQALGMSALISRKVVDECYYSLTTPEAVTAMIPFENVSLGEAATAKWVNSDALYTDAAFWKVFSFHFIAGRPYDETEFQSGLYKTVLSEKVARNVFGTSDVVGRTVEIDRVPFDVCGVVKDVPTYAESAFAGVWIPYTTSNRQNDGYDRDAIVGPFRICIMAYDSKDFDAIRQELDKTVAQFNSVTEYGEYRLIGQPDDLLGRYLRRQNYNTVNVRDFVNKYILIICILLFVPALNISGLIVSGLNKRTAEIGVRKAFGASRNELMKQVLAENLLQMLLGGVLGLILSSALIYMMSSFFLSSPTTAQYSSAVTPVKLWELVNPATIFYTVLACFLLNLLSSLIPVWRAVRISVVDAIKD